MMTDEGRVSTQCDMSVVRGAYAEEAKAETKLAGMRKLGNSLEMKIKMHVGQGKRYTFCGAVEVCESKMRTRTL